MNLRQFLARCRKDHPALTQSLWLSSLFVLVVIIVLLIAPMASAGPIVVDDQFDFNVGPLGWYGQGVGIYNPPDPGYEWNYVDPFWRVRSEPVQSKTYATGNYLFSPVINVTGSGGQLPGQSIDKVRLSIAHSFKLPNSIGAYPIAAGQVAYSINGGAFVGLPTSAFGTGLVTTPDPVFGASPLPPFVSQTNLVAPTYTPGSGLFPLIPGGASFVGTSPNYPTALVPSVAVFDINPSMVTIQFRLTNANLANECPSDAGWNVRFVQADFAAPEPGSFVLAALGCAFVGGNYLRRRRRNVTTALRAPA